MKLKDWLPHLGGKQAPEEKYIDSTEVPSEPEGPYRARMAVATHHPAPEGIDVNEREVVTGHADLVYRIHCPCGQHWETQQFQKMSLCTKCGRAVLVDQPALSTE